MTLIWQKALAWSSEPGREPLDVDPVVEADEALRLQGLSGQLVGILVSALGHILHVVAIEFGEQLARIEHETSQSVVLARSGAKGFPQVAPNRFGVAPNRNVRFSGTDALSLH